MNETNGTGTTVPSVPGHVSGDGTDNPSLYVPVSHPPGWGHPEKTPWQLIDGLTDDLSLILSEQVGRIVDATWGTLRTPNEYDSNGEPANVVDGLYAIARAIHHLAKAHEGVRTEVEHDEYHDGPLPFAEPDDRGRTKLRIPDELAAPRRANRNGHRP